MKNKATVVSPANIAFIKYWGKKDSRLNIPFNDSISMNLSNCLTTTIVQFDEKLKDDQIVIDGKKVQGLGRTRVILILDKVRKMSGMKSFVKVISKNNFPSDAGIASSAAGFSALALAASSTVGLNLNEKELSILARLGSGSACRSIPDGFTYWKRGTNNETSYAVQIAPPDFWDIRDVVVVVSSSKKKSGSTEGHSIATSSPYFTYRLKNLPKRIKIIKEAILKRDFASFGKATEEEAVDLHVMAMTSRPAIFYWNSGTMDVIHKVIEMREAGTLCYFTMDAGANVHVICQGKDEPKVRKILEKLSSVKFLISNKPGVGTRIIK